MAGDESNALGEEGEPSDEPKEILNEILEKFLGDGNASRLASIFHGSLPFLSVVVPRPCLVTVLWRNPPPIHIRNPKILQIRHVSLE
jgi:hypothetical protein